MVDRARVLYVVHGHPDFSPGGAELAALYMFNTTRQSDRYEPSLLATVKAPHGANRLFFRHETRERTLLFAQGESAYDTFFHTGKDLTPLTDYLTELRPAIVHIHHYLNYGIDLIPFVRTLLPGVKVVLTLHEYIAICASNGAMIRTGSGQLCQQASAHQCSRCFPERPLADFFVREQLFKSCFSGVDLFIAPSFFLRQRYIEWGLSPDRIVVVENGQPEAPRPARRTRQGTDPFVAAFIGQIVYHKGLDVFLEAAAEYLRTRDRHPPGSIPDVRFVVHGVRRQLPRDLGAQIDQRLAECQAVVRYHGAYVPEDVPPLLAQADCVVVPSKWWENSPLVIQEAFRAGVPVICSNIGGMAEKVADGENGLHFRFGDPIDLAGKIVELARSPELYDRLVAGIRAVPSDLETATAVHALYDQLLLAPAKQAA